MPSLTPDDWKLSGRLKVEPEDFVVEEIPAYEPCGTGEHLFLWIEKRDVSADFLLGHLARSLGIRRDDVGMAGIKDRRAVTRQWISVPASAETNVAAIERDGIRILQAARHGNKLKTGHLRGNRFEILLRPPAGSPTDESSRSEAVDRARRIISSIMQLGVPNDFGEQRFGIDGETLALGLSLLRGKTSAKEIPFKRRKFLNRLALSAVQSMLFNRVLARRREWGLLHEVQPGDVMQVVESGGLFVVEDRGMEQGRFDNRETVITGPLFGPKMKGPSGVARELEWSVLDESELTMAAFDQFRKLTPGGRRPLLLWIEKFDMTEEPDGLRFRFTLPAGAYATVVLREFLVEDAATADLSGEQPLNDAPVEC